MSVHEHTFETRSNGHMAELNAPFRTAAADYAWLRQEFPVVTQVAEVTNEALVSVDREKEKIQAQVKLKDAGNGMANPNQPESRAAILEKKINAVVRSGAAALSVVVSERDRDRLVREWLEPYYGHLRSHQSTTEDAVTYRNTVDVWTSDLLRAARIRTAYEAGQGYVGGFVERLAAGSVDDHYRMLKICGDVEHMEEVNEDDSDYDTHTAFLMLSSMYSARTGQPELATLLVEQLKAGKYDQYVARDMLRFIARADQAEQVGILRPVMQTYKLVRQVALGRTEDEVIDHMALSVADWTPDMQVPLRLLKENLESSVSLVSRWAEFALRDAGLLIPVDDGEQFRQAMNDFAHTQNPATNSVRQLLGQHLVTVSRDASSANGKAKPEVAPTSEAVIPRRKLVVVAPDGTSHQRGSDRFSNIIRDNIVMPEGSQTALMFDTVLDYMEANLDFSHGAPNGVKKYGDRITDEGKTVPVYGFKPKDAAGLSTSSRQKVDIRILFSMLKDENPDEPESIEILLVALRDKIPALAKRLGIRY